MDETTIRYDKEADILRIQFIPCADMYVHYKDQHLGTLHNSIDDRVVGIHIENWSYLKEAMTRDAKAQREYIASRPATG